MVCVRREAVVRLQAAARQQGSRAPQLFTCLSSTLRVTSQRPARRCPVCAQSPLAGAARQEGMDPNG